MKNQKGLEAAFTFTAEICTNSDFVRKCDLTSFCGAGEGSSRGEHHPTDFFLPRLLPICSNSSAALKLGCTSVIAGMQRCSAVRTKF